MKVKDDQLNELFMKRLLGGRGVVLRAKELGPAIAISSDFAVCARFFWPWSLRCRIAASSDQVSIEIPISQIVARGCAQDVLAALRNTPSWILRSLTWPHSVLDVFVSAGPAAAKAHLGDGRRWTLAGMADWEAAGVYCAALLEDRVLARTCFEKAAAGHLHRYQTDLRSLSWNWLRLCGDTDCALRCLYADMDSGPTGGSSDLLAWAPLIAHADAWTELFGRRDWASQYLEYASQAAAAPGAAGLFPAAIAWMSILGNEERSTDLARRAMSSKGEPLHFAMLYWHCVANDRAKAKDCLWSKQWSDYKSDRFRLCLAQCLVLFNQLGSGNEYVQHAEALVAEIARGETTDIRSLCSAAELWSATLGAGAEALLDTATGRAQESCELFDIAESWRRLPHLAPDTQLSGIGKVLARAEEIADNAMDFYFCARSWKTIAGDDSAVERCLVKGESCGCDPQDISLLAQGWTELLGRPEAARVLVLEKSPSILLKGDM